MGMVEEEYSPLRPNLYQMEDDNKEYIKKGEKYDLISYSLSEERINKLLESKIG
jgi:hypothetical protein